MIGAHDLAAAIAHLPDDAQVTISVRKADLVKALEQRAGGPAVMTTTQASRIHGYTDERWRRWAASGAIDGAYQDAAGGPWHLPRTAVEAHIATLVKRGATSRRASGLTLSPRSTPRGPWKAAARKGAAATRATRAQTS